jgi:hypothetical protein
MLKFLLSPDTAPGFISGLRTSFISTRDEYYVWLKMTNVALVKTGKGKPHFVDISQNLNVKAAQDVPKYKEHVFYTKYAKHTPGTNLYTFDFPAEWKTTINSILKFGIRAVYMIKSPRTLYWTLHIAIQKQDSTWEHHLIDFFYTLSPQTTIYDYINYLNQAFSELRIGIQATIKFQIRLRNFRGSISTGSSAAVQSFTWFLQPVPDMRFQCVL